MPTTPGSSAQNPAFSNPFIDALLWMNPTNLLKKVGTTTQISYSFGDAGTYTYFSPDAKNPTSTKASDFQINTMNWDNYGGLNAADKGPSGKIKLMNGDEIDLGKVSREDGTSLVLSGEKAAVYIGLKMWSSVADIQISMATTFDKATFKYLAVDQASMVDYTGLESVGGIANMQTNYSANVGYANTNYSPGYSAIDVSVWDQWSILPGGQRFTAMLHETGHLLGLDHPFDEDCHRNDGSAEPVFPVSQADQRVYSVMSYDAGLDFEGENAGLGAFDIAAVQAIYGVNKTYHATDDKYILPMEDANGLGWMCLWDTGGVDTISVAPTTKSAVIDLQDASLNVADGANAGGYVSRVDGVVGGFTIANGVVIENATGSSGNDSLRGNEFNNRLEGGAGNDTLVGGCGSDHLIGGVGADTFWYKNIHDFHDKLGSGGKQIIDYIDDFKSGTDKLSFKTFDSDPTSTYAPRTFTFIGDSDAIGEKVALKKDGTAQLMFSSKSNNLFGDVNGDGITDFTIKLTGVSSLKSTDFIL